MMKFIGRLLALLLATALSLTVSLWALGHTLGSASYLDHTADRTHLYDGLAAAAPGVSAAALRGQVQTALPQLINYLVKDGPAPTVDFGSGPVPLGPADPRLTSIIRAIRLIAEFAPIAVILLVLLIIATMRHRRLPILSQSALEAAVSLGLSAGLLWLAPSPILGSLSQAEIQPFKGALTPFITTLLHDLATQLGVAALALLAVAILLRLLHGALRLKARFARPAPPPPPPPPPPGPARA